MTSQRDDFQKRVRKKSCFKNHWEFMQESLKLFRYQGEETRRQGDKETKRQRDEAGHRRERNQGAGGGNVYTELIKEGEARMRGAERGGAEQRGGKQ